MLGFRLRITLRSRSRRIQPEITAAWRDRNGDLTNDGAGDLDLSLIVPAYNEQTCIASSIQTISSYLDGTGLDYEVIVVCDGSVDETPAIVERLTACYPRLRRIAYEPNRGKGYAVRTGVAASRGRAVMFTDADLSVPITILPDFLEALQSGYDIAIASRRHPCSQATTPAPRLRQVMTVVFSAIVRRLVVGSLNDTQCGCKAYRGDLARELFARQRIDHFSFDAEVLFLALRCHCRIKEVPFALDHAPSGSSIRPVRDSLIMLRDLVRIRANALSGAYDR